MALDGAGYLYVDDAFNSVVKVTPGGAISTFISVGDGLTSPLKTMAFDSSDNLYIVNGGLPDVSSDIVSKVTPNGSISTFVEANTESVAVLISGFVRSIKMRTFYVSYFVSNHSFGNAGPIVKVTPGGTVNPFVPMSANLSGALAFDPSGNLYGVANGSDNTVESVTPNGTISTVIPASAGLSRLLVEWRLARVAAFT